MQLYFFFLWKLRLFLHELIMTKTDHKVYEDIFNVI